MTKHCEGCGEKDCEPTYNEYYDLVLCDYCFQRADAKIDSDSIYQGMEYIFNADGRLNERS